MSTATDQSRTLRMNTLSVVLIVPQANRRKSLVAALAGPQARVAREFEEYPSIDRLTESVESDCDVLIMDLDTDSERALDLVETVCSEQPALTVMVYTGRKEPDVLVRCMRAGAREVLTEPLQPGAMAEALVRASARRTDLRRSKKAAGKVLVFCGAKGGCGVTTIASNFALALARESGQKVVLADLDVQLGDAALILGMTPEYSVADALQNADRLDSEFLGSLTSRHSSGLSVLAASDQYINTPLSAETGGKVIRLLRDDFPYVVVDAGDTQDRAHDTLFEIADSVYVVAEISIPALRNTNRMLMHFAEINASCKPQVVLNRYEPNKLEVDEARITKAIGDPGKWKLPNDFASVRRAQNTGEPLSLDGSALGRSLVQMAREACGKVVEPVKKKRFGLFG